MTKLSLLFCLLLSGVLSSCNYLSSKETAVSRNKRGVSLDSALEFVNGSALIQSGLSGKGVKIGIIDVGFYGANREPALTDIFIENRIAGTRDFVDTLRSDFFRIATRHDKHGTDVFRYIAGKDSITQYGLATQATFYLARTDDASKESRSEEENFLKALEWLNSQGVRLVNVSLGYGFGFDNPNENYWPDELNGKTALISKAAQNFIEAHNFIIVASAGNNGQQPWKCITAPADAPGVITVGLTDWRRQKNKVSSEGITSNEFLKPNIACFNTLKGTSFSAPVITGLIACMLERDPSLTCERITSILKQTAHLYPYGNNYLGYGVPDATRVIASLNGTNSINTAENKKGHTELKLDCTQYGHHYTLFHKKDDWIVLAEEEITSNDSHLVVRQPAPISHSVFVGDNKSKLRYHTTDVAEPVRITTVVTEKNVIEINWN
jgi:subtilisin family serine protease